jgi:hypothetical protein
VQPVADLDVPRSEPLDGRVDPRGQGRLGRAGCAGQRGGDERGGWARLPKDAKERRHGIDSWLLERGG